MASSEHPQSSETPAPTGIQTSAETPPVSLPPLPQKPALAQATFLRLRGWLDALLVVTVLLFAFLVASFPASNPDFFRQLAIGRLILQGQYHFGVDPFVYTADNDYFVNHSWLFGLLMYGLYQMPAIGAAAVVIFKALLSAVLAVVLLRAGRREGQSLWIPSACTALAILVVSPRLHLQSPCLSFLFLGVTVWLLTSVGKSEARLWWLPPLFALWVNCDSWFFLGPLTVALYLAGDLLGHWLRREPAINVRTLVLVLVVGVAACLINPHHIHAFTLPPEFGLTPTGGLIENDPQFRMFLLSPLAKDYYQPYLGLNVAGLAYWPLLLLGLASFVSLFVIGQAPWPRLLVWSGFALMSLYNVRAIPFFAVLAGPIASLNWLDFAVQRLGTAPRLTRPWRNWSLSGRTLTVLLGLVLLIATVPGWLHRSQPPFSRIGWSVEVDPSLQAMAEAIRDWSEAKLLPDEPHWFNMHQEIANYLAWFAPGQRVFLDQSLPYYREAAQDYLDIRKGLKQMSSERQEDERDSLALKIDWRKILRKREVRYWISDNRGTHDADVVARLVLFTRPKEWVLCHLKGRIAIFAWRDPQQPGPDPSTGLALDLKRIAFGPKAEQAPASGAEPPPPSEWWRIAWDAWWQPNPPPSSDREVVGLYDFLYYVRERPQQIQSDSRVWQVGVAAGAIAHSLPHGPMPGSLLALSWSCTYNDLFPPEGTEPTRQPGLSEKLAMQAIDSYVNNQFIEPATLYLAVRAARRALRVNPEDSSTYFRLGETYQRLQELSQEQNFRASAPQLAAIRRTQLTAAFQNCLRLQPDDNLAAQAHEALFWVYYRQLGYIDAAVHHLRQAIEKQTALGPRPGASTQFNQALDRMNADLTKLDGELERRLNRYEVNAAAKTGLEKVKVALEQGLSETALAVLEEQAADMNPNSLADMAILRQMKEVVLNLGHLDKARGLFPDFEGPLKLEDMDQYVRLAAARGDYEEADRILSDALRHAWQPPPGQPRVPEPASAVGSLVGRVLLAEGQHLMGVPCVPWLTNNPADIFLRPFLAQNASEFWRRRWRMEAVLTGLLAVQQQADWNLTRGWLALEAGRCAEARKHFQNTRDNTVPLMQWAPEVDRLNAWLAPREEIPRIQQLGYRQVVLRALSQRYLRWLEEKPNP